MGMLQVPWGIISVKVGFNIRLGMSNIAILLCSMHYGYVQAQDEDFETPMQPMTMMRNALVSMRRFCTCPMAPV